MSWLRKPRCPECKRPYDEARSTPPLDEWLKGEEAVDAIRAKLPRHLRIVGRELSLAPEIRNALLEALAEHRFVLGEREERLVARYALITERRQFKRLKGAVDDELRHRPPTAGDCCRPCPEKPLANMKFFTCWWKPTMPLWSSILYS